MMLQSNGFLPNTLIGWLTVTAMIGGWIASLIVLYNRLIVKVNGLGDRTNVLELASSEKLGRMKRVEDEIKDFRRLFIEGASTVGELKNKIDVVDDHVTALKIEMLKQFSDQKDFISEKDTLLRERVARLESFHDSQHG